MRIEEITYDDLDILFTGEATEEIEIDEDTFKMLEGMIDEGI